MPKFQFTSLTRDHDRNQFDCGVPELNQFLKQQARRQQEKGVSRTHVLVDEDEPGRILGFFTLVASQLDSRDLAPEHQKRLPNRAPCVLLARLAVAKTEQGKKLGSFMMAEVYLRASSVSRDIGVAGLFVEAKDAQAAAFYEKFGFVPFANDPLKLFQEVRKFP